MKVTTYFCHRCGKELTDEDKNTIVGQIEASPQFRAVLSMPDGSERGYCVDMVDFCAACHAAYQKAIAQFMEEK